MASLGHSSGLPPPLPAPTAHSRPGSHSERLSSPQQMPEADATQLWSWTQLPPTDPGMPDSREAPQDRRPDVSLGTTQENLGSR